MTVSELFAKERLKLHGPIRWGTRVRRDDASSSSGVYIVARTRTATKGCKACSLPLRNPTNLRLNREYEQQRWLRKEPILYIGQTRGPIYKRIEKFYRQKVESRSGHSGGKIIKLLQCKLWVYWSPVKAPLIVESKLIRAFEKRTAQIPFANAEKGRRVKRICVN